MGERRFYFQSIWSIMIKSGKELFTFDLQCKPITSYCFTHREFPQTSNFIAPFKAGGLSPSSRQHRMEAKPPVPAQWWPLSSPLLPVGGSGRTSSEDIPKCLSFFSRNNQLRFVCHNPHLNTQEDIDTHYEFMLKKFMLFFSFFLPLLL